MQIASGGQHLRVAQQIATGGGADVATIECAQQTCQLMVHTQQGIGFHQLTQSAPFGVVQMFGLCLQV